MIESHNHIGSLYSKFIYFSFSIIMYRFELESLLTFCFEDESRYTYLFSIKFRSMLYLFPYAYSHRKLCEFIPVCPAKRSYYYFIFFQFFCFVDNSMEQKERTSHIFRDKSLAFTKVLYLVD